jgi:hypothetical protein
MPVAMCFMQQPIDLLSPMEIPRFFDQALRSSPLERIMTHLVGPVIPVTYFRKVNFEVTFLFIFSLPVGPF